MSLSSSFLSPPFSRRLGELFLAWLTEHRDIQRSRSRLKYFCVHRCNSTRPNSRVEPVERGESHFRVLFRLSHRAIHLLLLLLLLLPLEPLTYGRRGGATREVHSVTTFPLQTRGLFIRLAGFMRRLPMSTCSIVRGKRATFNARKREFRMISAVVLSCLF